MDRGRQDRISSGSARLRRRDLFRGLAAVLRRQVHWAADLAVEVLAQAPDQREVGCRLALARRAWRWRGDPQPVHAWSQATYLCGRRPAENPLLDILVIFPVGG